MSAVIEAVRVRGSTPAHAPHVRIGRLAAGADAPVVVTPARPGVDLAGWAGENRPWMDAALHRAGALLFRGFGVDEADELGRFLRAGAGPPLACTCRATRRARIRGNLYLDGGQPAPFHAELSYARAWPLRVGFLAQAVAATGGETPLADARRVYQRVPAEIRDRFERLGVTYVRNHTPWMDLPWQDAFGAATRAEVDALCRAEGIRAEWVDDDHLRTRQTCQGVATHPVTGEKVWMNQAHLFHATAQDPEVVEMLVEQFGEESLPRNACYGDGSPIRADELRAVRDAYAAEAVVFAWEAGDVLLLDNMLTAHARAPFTGARRVVAGTAHLHAGGWPHA